MKYRNYINQIAVSAIHLLLPQSTIKCEKSHLSLFRLLFSLFELVFSLTVVAILCRENVKKKNNKIAQDKSIMSFPLLFPVLYNIRHVFGHELYFIDKCVVLRAIYTFVIYVNIHSEYIFNSIINNCIKMLNGKFSSAHLEVLGQCE